MRLKPHHIHHLREHGYVVLRRFLTPAELKAARQATLAMFPPAEELAARPLRYRHIVDNPDFQQIEFPYDQPALNQIALHPQILAGVEAMLGHSDIILSRSSLWAKYAGLGDYDQPMHADFEGNTLVFPREDGDYRQVNIILYYSDVDATLGPTHVVSQQHTREQPLWPPFRPREEYPQLYELAEPVMAKAGDMLIFAMSTFHRGSAMTADLGVRFSHHLVYRSQRHPFQGYQHWASYGEQAELQHFLETATPRQREALGFPKIGDPYWNKETLAGVALRYPRMDLRPYTK